MRIIIETEDGEVVTTNIEDADRSEAEKIVFQLHVDMLNTEEMGTPWINSPADRYYKEKTSEWGDRLMDVMRLMGWWK